MRGSDPYILYNSYQMVKFLNEKTDLTRISSVLSLFTLVAFHWPFFRLVLGNIEGSELLNQLNSNREKAEKVLSYLLSEEIIQLKDGILSV